MRCSCLLSYNLACVEFDKHCTIGFELLHRDGKTKVVEDQELKFEMVELDEWKTSNL